MESAVPIDLGAALRSQTQALHTQVERSGIMQALLRGQIDRVAYGALLRNLHVIYDALETALGHHAGRPEVAPVIINGLARRAALAHDLVQLQGPQWAMTTAVVPAAAQYVDRLVEIDAHRPGLLAAHAYVRYLGDLSGGQTLRRIVARSPALGETPPTRFYEFGEDAAAAALAMQFRQGLAAIRVDAADIAALVAEACWGFAQHGKLFEQLQSPAVASP